MFRLGTKLQLRLGWMTVSLVATAAAGACSSSGSNGSPSSGSTSTSTATMATSSSTSSTSSSTSSSASTGTSSSSSSACTVVFPFNESNLCGPNGAALLPVQCNLCNYNEQGCWFLDAPPPAVDAGDGSAGATVDAGGVSVPAPIPCSNPTYTCVYPAVAFVNNGPDAGGDPFSCSDPGYLELTIPFDGYNQQSDIQWIFSTPQDFSAYTVLYVRYELLSGFVTDMNAAGAFEVALKSGAGFNYASTAYTMGQLPVPVPTGGSGWKEADFDLASPQSLGTGPDGGPVTFDDTQVMALELHFDTGGGPLADAGAGPQPVTAVFAVDMVGLK